MADMHGVELASSSTVTPAEVELGRLEETKDSEGDKSSAVAKFDPRKEANAEDIPVVEAQEFLNGLPYIVSILSWAFYAGAGANASWEYKRKHNCVRVTSVISVIFYLAVRVVQIYILFQIFQTRCAKDDGSQSLNPFNTAWCEGDPSYLNTTSIYRFVVEMFNHDDTPDGALLGFDYCYESTTSPTTIVTLTQEGVEGVDLDRGRAYQIFPRTYTSAADRTQCQAACLADTRCGSWTHMYKAEPPDAENPSWSCYLLLRDQGTPPCPIFRPGEEAGHKNLYWSGVRTPINITRANCPCAGEADMVERLHYNTNSEPWSLSSKMLSNPEDFGCAAMQGRSYGDRDLEQCQGDCNSDADCKGDLRCWQRNQSTALPPACFLPDADEPEEDDESWSKANSIQVGMLLFIVFIEITINLATQELGTIATIEVIDLLVARKLRLKGRRQRLTRCEGRFWKSIELFDKFLELCVFFLNVFLTLDLVLQAEDLLDAIMNCLAVQFIGDLDDHVIDAAKALKEATNAVKGYKTAKKPTKVKPGHPLGLIPLTALQDGDADVEFIKAAVAMEGDLLQVVHKKFRSDKAIVLAAVKQDCTALAFASTDLKLDRDLHLTAIEGKASAFSSCPKDLQCDPEFMKEAAAKNGYVVKHFDGDLEREVALIAIGSGVNCLYWILHKGSFDDDKELILEAVKKNKGAFRRVPNKLKVDPDIFKAACAHYNDEEKTE